MTTAPVLASNGLNKAESSDEPVLVTAEHLIMTRGISLPSGKLKKVKAKGEAEGGKKKKRFPDMAALKRRTSLKRLRRDKKPSGSSREMAAVRSGGPDPSSNPSEGMKKEREAAEKEALREQKKQEKETEKERIKKKHKEDKENKERDKGREKELKELKEPKRLGRAFSFRREKRDPELEGRKEQEKKEKKDLKEKKKREKDERAKRAKDEKKEKEAEQKKRKIEKKEQEKEKEKALKGKEKEKERVEPGEKGQKAEVQVKRPGVHESPKSSTSSGEVSSFSSGKANVSDERPRRGGPILQALERDILQWRKDFREKHGRFPTQKDIMESKDNIRGMLRSYRNLRRIAEASPSTP